MNKTSREEIVSNYLASSLSPEEYLERLHAQHDQYNGFNILVGDQEQLYHYNNLNKQMTRIPHGTHGVSNHLLNTPWPKVIKRSEEHTSELQSRGHLVCRLLLEK